VRERLTVAKGLLMVVLSGLQLELRFR
jgi:hypothetical protein